MLCQEHSHLLFFIQPLDDVENFCHQQRRKPHGGLVKEHDPRLGHQASPDGTHLHLTAGDVAGLDVTTFFKTRKILVDFVQSFLDRFFVATPGVCAGEQIILHAEVFKGVPAFHDLDDTHFHQLGGKEFINALAVKFHGPFGDLAALGLYEVGNRFQSGALTGPVCP